MKRFKTGLGVLMVSAISAWSGKAQPEQPGMSELALTAVKYNFTPRVIKVKKGDRVKLVITAEGSEQDSSSWCSASIRGRVS